MTWTRDPFHCTKRTLAPAAWSRAVKEVDSLYSSGVDEASKRLQTPVVYGKLTAKFFR